MADDGEGRRCMGEAARVRVTSDYTVERAVDGTLAALRALGALA
jgi:hypothetical protein